jgi:hypothetical protein
LAAAQRLFGFKLVSGQRRSHKLGFFIEKNKHFFVFVEILVILG